MSERVWAGLVDFPIADHILPFIAQVLRKQGIELGVDTFMLVPHVEGL